MKQVLQIWRQVVAKILSKYPDKHFNEKLMVEELEKHKLNIKFALKLHGSEVKRVLILTIKGARGKGTHYSRLPNRSSAPGEVPVSQSGNLARSFGYRARTTELLVFNKARSDKGAPYPAFLNQGTKKMAPRQYFDSTIEAMAILLKNDLANLDWFD